MVERPVTGDGRGPAAKARTVTAEPPEVPCYFEPGVGGDVLGVLADHPPQVSQQPGVHDPISLCEGRLVAGLGSLDSTPQRNVVSLHRCQSVFLRDVVWERGN